MVDRREAEDGVGAGERCRRRRAERRQRPPTVGDPVDAGAVGVAGEEDEREVLRTTRVGVVPAGERYGVGVDRLHVVDRRAQVARSAAPTQDVDGHVLDRCRLLAVLGVGDDDRHLPELHLALEPPVGPEQHGDGTEAVQRSDDAERAGAGVHENADVRAATDADLDESTDDVVDALVGSAVGVPTTFEQEHGVVGRRPRLLLDHRAHRDPRRRLDLVDAVEAHQRADTIDGEVARRLDPVAGAVGDRSPEPRGDVGSEGHGSLQVALGAVGGRAVGVEGLDAGRTFAAVAEPLRPVDDRGPGDLHGLRADDQTEVAGLEFGLVDVGGGGGGGDGSHRVLGGDVVLGADETEDRAVDVGERHRTTVDHEPAGEHPVRDDELLDQFGERRAGPRDPALVHQESTLTLAGEQRVAVVELGGELDLVADRADRVEHAEAGLARPRRHRHVREHAVGDEVDGVDEQFVVEAERHLAVRVDRAAVGDDAGEALRPAVGGGLVTEHAALAVAGEVDVATGRFDHLVDGGGQRDDVVGEGAFEPALLALWRTEVDDPRIDARGGELTDGAGLGRHVVDVGRQHHRRDEDDRRPADVVVPGRRVAVAAQLVDAVRRHDLVGRRFLAGLEPAEAGDLQRVLRGLPEPHDRSGQSSRSEIHVAILRFVSLSGGEATARRSEGPQRRDAGSGKMPEWNSRGIRQVRSSNGRRSARTARSDRRPCRSSTPSASTSARS